MIPTTTELNVHLSHGLSERAIGEIYGVSRNIVHSWLYYERKHRRTIPTAELIATGLTLGLTERQIGMAIDVARTTIQGMRRKFGIAPTRPGRRRLKPAPTGNPKPHRPEEQPYRVILLDDESVWAKCLAGKRYQDTPTTDGGIMRRLPAASLTADSSMANCANW